MTAIVDNFTHPVILADARDPDVSWQHHLDRGSLGGVDLAYPYGTNVHANADGTISYLKGSGSGGWMALLRLADGRAIEYLHLGPTGPEPRRVRGFRM